MNGEEAPQSLLDLLDKLVEAPEPTPVSWAPQTWGWAALVLILFALAVWFALRSLRRYRANAYRRAALAELDRAGDDPAVVADILRRTALAAYPRVEVASLTGESWLRFLDTHAKEGGFVDGAGRTIAAAPYRPVPSAPGLAPLARRWIGTHRAAGNG